MAGTTWGDYAEEASKAGGSFGPHPKGVFNMRIDTAEVKSAQNDRKAILARMVTIDGPAAGQSILNNMAPYKNNGDENGFFMQQLAALGFGRETNPEFWIALDGLTHEQGVAYIAQAIVGAQATVTVNHRKYQDEWKDNIKGVVPFGTKPITTVLEPEIVQPTLPGAVAIPGVASSTPTPVAAIPGAPAPIASAQPVATPVVAPPVAPVAAAIVAAPTPVAQPVVAAPPVAVPDTTPAAVPEAVPADVPDAPVATPVGAPVPPVARPEGAPF